ncbi:GNAT family N-acetyltransferase [Stieleria sp. TO1_6]|uniref:GNAT family N-acetyltransferase n=1 Tax=Stieleria tagensis TaxID=2956795 RepID=UPI00209B497F|nr:GNAT family N-acetyltransferase [Stieleria tagensis]MCO8120799.1 GNAT family N-acetyltransferase [Stieleria tagensis]
MNFFHTPLRWSYALSRRLGMIDVTGLYQLTADRLIDGTVPTGYTIRTISPAELSDLIAGGMVHPQVGAAVHWDKPGRRLVAAFAESRMVSFTGLATQFVAGSDNYSRAIHLGTSIDLPAGTLFVYNAWTDPDHRGKRLLAALIRWAISNQIDGAPLDTARSLATMIDCANTASCRAFEKLGMQRLGWVVRMGRGPIQISLLPASASQAGLRVAADAPGIRIAL